VGNFVAGKDRGILVVLRRDSKRKKTEGKGRRNGERDEFLYTGGVPKSVHLREKVRRKKNYLSLS